MSQNKESKKKDKNIIIVKAFPTWASTLIVVISILEVAFIIALFTLFLFCKIPPHFFEKAAESSLLASGIAIIGIAVAVWAGLNIANAIERKEYESLKEDVNTTKNILNNYQTRIFKLSSKVSNIDSSINVIESKQSRADKAKLLNELFNTVDDVSTQVLIETIEKAGESLSIDYLPLIELERIFNNVRLLHTSDYKYDSALIRDADKGIKLTQEMLNIYKGNSIYHYIAYRMADFYFYKGYCVSGKERLKSFLFSADGYLKTASALSANLPEYDSKATYPYDNKYEGCSASQLKISAYVCNSIGESYSKIIQIKDKLLSDKISSEDDINEYGKKAVFYCAYAAHWGDRETYWRNLGCAIERHNNMTRETFETLFNIYSKALSIEANPLTFKVYLSLLDKSFNKHLGINYVKESEEREPPISDESYYKAWDALDTSDKEKLLELLKSISENSRLSKTLYPENIVGYTYSCLYYRDMCIINRSDKNVAMENLEKANEAFRFVELIDPRGNMTTFLRKDLCALSTLYREEEHEKKQ